MNLYTAGGSLSLTGNTHGQDVLSFNPQITFFKKVYKRHTNFGIETVRQSNVIGDLNFGTNNTITIEKKGSLITDMHFEFTLPPAVVRVERTLMEMTSLRILLLVVR